jgi:hypothetical protein
VTSASPPGRKAIAHGTTRPPTSTEGWPMLAAGSAAPLGAGAPPAGELTADALPAGDGPPSVAQAPQTRPAHTAIAAMDRGLMG